MGRIFSPKKPKVKSQEQIESEVRKEEEARALSSLKETEEKRRLRRLEIQDEDAGEEITRKKLLGG